jgi:hypothetical protein
MIPAWLPGCPARFATVATPTSSFVSTCTPAAGSVRVLYRTPHGSPASRGLYQLFDSRSFATLSSVRSSTTRYGLAFSSARCRDFLASFTSSSPNFAFHW